MKLKGLGRGLDALLADTRAQFGDTHPRTDLVLTNLALVQLAAGDGPAAVDAARRLLDSGIVNYGTAHPYVTDARGVLLIALLLANQDGEAGRVRRQLQGRCSEAARDAHMQLVKLACARADHDAAALADSEAALDAYPDAMAWQKRLAARWRDQATTASP